MWWLSSNQLSKLTSTVQSIHMKPQTKVFAIIGTVVLLMIISLSYCLVYSWFHAIVEEEFNTKIASTPETDVGVEINSVNHDQIIQDDSNNISVDESLESHIVLTKSLPSNNSIAAMEPEVLSSFGDDDPKDSENIIPNGNIIDSFNENIIQNDENGLFIDNSIVEEVENYTKSPLSAISEESDQSGNSFIKI